MAAKPESATPAAPAAAAPAAAEKKKGIAAFLPLVLSCVLAPAATWAVAEFVLLPRLKAQLVVPAASSDGTVAATPPAAAHAAPAGKGAPEAAASYEFSNVVVNLAGTMGTRYLKTTFLVTGADPAIKSVFEGQKPRLTDVTLNVLSSLTLADLEEPGARNIIREKLVLSYNQALGRKVAEQVYFSDFVVQ
jgi:flagellar FliL protein